MDYGREGMSRPLSNTESFMWSLGDDPNLASTMGLVVVLAETPDRNRMRNTIGALLGTVDRLRLRVADTAGPVSPSPSLEWTSDDQFDLDYHLRFSRLDTSRPVGPSHPSLLALAAQFINDPFDRTRPLWQFHLVTGLSGGRAALLAKFHHSISDGMGMVRLGLNLLDFEAGAEPRPEPDIDAFFAVEPGADDHADTTDDENDGGGGNPLGGLQRLWDAGEGIVTSVKAAGVSLTGGPTPSPIWAERSRNRTYEVVVESLDSMKQQADKREVTINDLFVTACAQAALHYHTERGVDLEHVLATVVINLSPPEAGGAQSADGAPAGREENAFLPVALEIPGTEADLDQRLLAVKAAIRAKREMLTGKSSALDALATLGNIVPPSVAARMMVEQASRVDFATSNVPGLPLPAWCAGSEAEAMYPVGPVTGTAFNATLLSYAGRSYIGLHIDPKAVDDPTLLAKSLGRSFRQLGVKRL